MKYIAMTPPAECLVSTKMKNESLEELRVLHQAQWKKIVEKWKQQALHHPPFQSVKK